LKILPFKSSGVAKSSSSSISGLHLPQQKLQQQQRQQQQQQPVIKQQKTASA